MATSFALKKKKRKKERKNMWQHHTACGNLSSLTRDKTYPNPLTPPSPHPQHWNCGVLITGPPRKTLAPS